MSRSRAKGTEFETALVNLMVEVGFPEAFRLPFASPLGDIEGLPVVVEAKNQKALKLSEWMKQAEESGRKAGRPFVLFHKRIRKSTRKAYATCDTEFMLEILLCWMRSNNIEPLLAKVEARKH